MRIPTNLVSHELYKVPFKYDVSTLSHLLTRGSANCYNFADRADRTLPIFVVSVDNVVFSEEGHKGFH